MSPEAVELAQTLLSYVNCFKEVYICRSILQNDGLYFNVFADFVSSVQCVLKNFKSSWQTQLNQAGIVAYGELKDDVFSIKIMFLALMGTLR